MITASTGATTTADQQTTRQPAISLARRPPSTLPRAPAATEAKIQPFSWQDAADPLNNSKSDQRRRDHQSIPPKIAY